MIFPWARVLISAGAHGLRRIPGQSVNLAHLIWRTPRAPAPLQGAPSVVFRAGLWVLAWEKEERAALAAAGITGLDGRKIQLRTLLVLLMLSHKPKPCHPTQGLPPPADSLPPHSDLPQQAPLA